MQPRCHSLRHHRHLPSCRRTRVVTPWDKSVKFEKLRHRRQAAEMKEGTELNLRLDATLKRLDNLEASFVKMQEILKQIAADDAPEMRVPDKPEAKKMELVTGRVTVCQGKDCRKQGGAQTLKRIEALLRGNPAMQGVRLKTCKCLSECGKGPAIATKFGSAKGVKHKRVKLRNVDTLIAKEIEKAR